MSINELKKIISEGRNIVFFGGAGVSTESNIPDFRGAKGLYSEKFRMNFSPEEIVSRSFFINYTREFYDFYKSKLIYPEAKPNKAHLALSELESRGKLKAIITQNIDGLHQAAGSKCVYELHGSIQRNFCIKCHCAYDVSYILAAEGVPSCEKCGGLIKPDVVLYEEPLDHAVLEAAVEAVSKADTLIIGGTSLTVYPAAGIIDYFKGRKLVLINKTATDFDSRADLIIKERIGEVLNEVVFGNQEIINVEYSEI